MSDPDRETRTGRVRVGSLSLRYSISGSPHADGRSRPLLLVNGIGANVEMWTPFRRALGDRCTVAFDVPGTGNSSTPLRPLTMRELGRVATGLLDALELRDVDVLGYSFGGAIAQEMARADDGRIAHLVLAATTCGWGTVPGDPLSLARDALTGPLLLRSRHDRVHRRVGQREARRVRDRRRRPPAPSAGPARVLLAGARGGELVVAPVAARAAGAVARAGRGT